MNPFMNIAEKSHGQDKWHDDNFGRHSFSCRVQMRVVRIRNPIMAAKFIYNLCMMSLCHSGGIKENGYILFIWY